MQKGNKCGGRRDRRENNVASRASRKSPFATAQKEVRNETRCQLLKQLVRATQSNPFLGLTVLSLFQNARSNERENL